MLNTLLNFVKNFFIVILAECADMWYELSSKEKEENIHVMKIYLLSPFLFGQVKSNQDDKVNCGIRNTIASQNTTWIQVRWMAWLVLQLLSLNCLLVCSENLLFHLWLLAALAFVMFGIPWRVLIIIIPDLCQPVCKYILYVLWNWLSHLKFDQIDHSSSEGSVWLEPLLCSAELTCCVCRLASLCC